MSQLTEFKCPSCGGTLVFNSRMQKLVCSYCGTEMSMDVAKEFDEEVNSIGQDDYSDFHSHNNEYQTDEASNLREYVCESCGGTVVTDDSTSATSCPYCGSPVVVNYNVAGSYKPDYVIPFKLDKNQAKKAFEKHLSGKPLAPSFFSKDSILEEIKGVYVPFWMYDTDVNTKCIFDCQRNTYWSDSNYDYHKVDYYSVYRDCNIGFENVPVNSSSKVLDNMMESIEPYNMDEAVEFETAYLSGYFADKYEYDADEVLPEATSRMKETTESYVAKTISSYDTVRVRNHSMHYDDALAKYCLLPVWLLSVNYKGEKYKFAMNGQTGKFVGDIPVDKQKYLKYFILIALGIGIIASAIQIMLKVF